MWFGSALFKKPMALKTTFLLNFQKTITEFLKLEVIYIVNNKPVYIPKNIYFLVTYVKKEIKQIIVKPFIKDFCEINDLNSLFYLH